MFGKSTGPGFNITPLPPAPPLLTTPNTCTIAEPVGLVEVQPPPPATYISVPAVYPVKSIPSIKPSTIPVELLPAVIVS